MYSNDFMVYFRVKPFYMDNSLVVELYHRLNETSSRQGHCVLCLYQFIRVHFINMVQIVNKFDIIQNNQSITYF